MVFHGVNIPQSELKDFCRRHGVKKLSVYGSIVRDDFTPGSDIDVLVEFPGPTPSLFTLGGMLMELRDMFGREVDLKTPGFIADDYRDRIMREARVLYAA